MKNTKLFGWAFIAAMLGTGFSACTNEAEEMHTQESEIKLTSEITRSRVTSDLQSEQLEEGRSIGVTITGSKSGDDYVNKVWTSDGEGGLSTEHTVYWANTDIDVVAYHPYNEGWASGSQTFTVSSDQSVEANYLNSDLLFASKPDVAKTENAISLEFDHKLAKVNVTLLPEYDTDAERTKLNDAIITICNVKPSTTIDLSNGQVSTEATGEVQEIKAGVGLTASAIVAPQTIVASTKFIKVQLGEKTFYYTLPAEKVLTSGYSHNYTLTVKETAVKIANSSVINNWTPDNDEENTGDAEEEEEEEDVNAIPDNEIWYTTTDGQAINDPQVSFGANIISNQYFDGKGIIRFNGNVTEIGKDAFDSYTSLTSITIPNSVTTIGKTAFYGCTSLTSVTIPNSVTTIGACAFSYCDLLEEIIVEGNNTIYDSRNGCNAIIQTETNTLIAGCKNTIIPNNVNKIDDGAFFKCSYLTSITIPNSVTEIGAEAFNGCTSLSTVYVMATTPPILGSDVFEFCRSSIAIYVPIGTVTTYQNAANWSKYASKIIEKE